MRKKWLQALLGGALLFPVLSFNNPGPLPLPDPLFLDEDAVSGGGMVGSSQGLLDELRRVAAPLGIGKVSLAGGGQVSCFLCEANALRTAEEITPLGGWRAYMASLAEKGAGMSHASVSRPPEG